MVKIFGEIDTVDSPVMFTPWAFKHLTNTSFAYLFIYIHFIFLKNIFKRYPLKSNRKQYLILFSFLQWVMLTIIKGSQAGSGNIIFGVINGTIIYYWLNNIYLGQEKESLTKSFFLDKYFSKKNINLYNYQPFNKFQMMCISLYITLFVHTIYEYYTAGAKGKDSWWNSAFGSIGAVDTSHRLSNSYLNSFGDTVGALFGCLYISAALKKYGLKFAIPLAFVLRFFTGSSILEIYRDMGFILD